MRKQMRFVIKTHDIHKKRIEILDRQYQDPDEEDCPREQKMQNLGYKTAYMLMTGGMAGSMAGMGLTALLFDAKELEVSTAYTLFVAGTTIGASIGTLLMRYASWSPFRDCNHIRELNEEYASIRNSF